MPDWDTFFRSYDIETWVRECEQQDRMMEQQMREAEELRADKVKYPLFFLKEGIL